MPVTYKYARRCIQFFVFCTACLIIHKAPLAAEATEYKVGVIPQYEQRKLYRTWRPVLDRLETLTGLRFTLVGTSKISEFEKHLLAGAFDIAYVNPFNVIQSHQSQSYEPIINDSSRKLTGIVTVHRDSDIKHPAQLANKSVALPSPNAFGASLMIRAELAKLYNVTIRPVYVQTHSSVYLHVAKRLVDAGGGVITTLASQDQNIRQALRIIHETQGIAPHPVVIHPRVSSSDRNRISAALLQMGNNTADSQLLAKIPIHKVSSTSYNDYKSLTELGLNKFYINE